MRDFDYFGYSMGCLMIGFVTTMFLAAIILFVLGASTP